MAVAALLFISCNDSINDVENSQTERSATVPVRVHVSGFSVSQDDFSDGMTRATAVASYGDVKVVTVAFYSGSTLVSTATQLRSDDSTYDTFGEFTCTLPMGSYTMVVLAHGKDVDDALVLTSPTLATYTGAHTRETFAVTQAVNITSNTAVDVSATLNRIVAKLRVVSLDGRTENVTKIRTSFSAGSKGFNPTTGFAANNTGFVHTGSTSKAVGETTSSVSYLFLTSDEQNVDVTIETLDSDDNVIFSKTVPNVPFRRNRITTLTGNMYTNDAVSGGFQLNTSWLTDYNGEF